ncbi:MAG: DEAD/DEAH box helicase [Oscillospiraceae bacterium]|nr:DEAD/DEAH box helicase [Oscillospiraceae bacterium]
MQFNEFNLSQELLMAVKELGFSEMTDIQKKTIPLLTDGYDVTGRSNTGTGKTAAFGIPAVETIQPNDKNVSVLILCPTRELAMQACEELKKFSKYKKFVKICAVYGGASMEKQIHELKRGVNIVVGTPGRVMDHMRRKTLKLDNLKTIILDEADEMLNMGFREDIETILASVPEERQTVLFSATMSPEILAITKKYQNNPVNVKIEEKYKTVDLIDQYWFEVAMGRKTDALKLLLSAYSPKSSMIFCNTKKMVDELTEELAKSGFKVSGLHGDMKQIQRTQVMNSFKNGFISILIATDVAARGIDVNGIDAVFNYDLPQDNEYYIHRIGRTGRAGHKGTAYTLISGRKQIYALKDISKFTKAEITELPLPEKKDIINLKLQNIFDSISEFNGNISKEAYALAKRLEDSGLNTTEIIAQMIDEKFQYEINSLPEFDMPSPLRKSKRKDKNNTSKIEINIGRSQRTAPNFILGALADATGMSGKDFGKIDIFDKYTTVEIPSAETDYIIDVMNNSKINGYKVEVKVYERKSKDFKSEKSNKPDSRREKNGRKGRFSSKGRYQDSSPKKVHRTKKRH